MQLKVTDEDKIIDTDFGLWLCDIIKLNIKSQLSKYNFTVWNNYLTTSQLPRMYSRNYCAEDIMIQAANNLVCTGGPGNISIHVNTAQLTSGFKQIKLNTLVKTINYGILSIKGCPIITDVFTDVAKHIDQYVTAYYDV